ncbi:hypothetical protein QBC38DRAFT_525034 [Podospora fimiseda]|uniref:Secreted protein n=1 Tax=Podospora fimiseda TaxID=252190 RepID=A0AAN7BRA1_9PEZI|nr:hypothetical protein QBC38DRAFT_525034 [Podospora fimiseda]
MKTTTFVTAIAACLATASASSIPARCADNFGLPEGYTVTELSWELETTPGGPKVALNGTVEQVHAQLLEINPNYDVEFAAVEAGAEDVTAVDSRELQKRDWTERIIDGIAYLRSLGSRSATNGPGPNNCARVSCSWSSAIWYCNNNSFSKTMGFNHIANAAQVLVNECSYKNTNAVPRTWGERWHDDQWFAIVNQQDC